MWKRHHDTGEAVCWVSADSLLIAVLQYSVKNSPQSSPFSHAFKLQYGSSYACLPLARCYSHSITLLSFIKFTSLMLLFLALRHRRCSKRGEGHRFITFHGHAYFVLQSTVVWDDSWCWATAWGQPVPGAGIAPDRLTTLSCSRGSALRRGMQLHCWSCYHGRASCHLHCELLRCSVSFGGGPWHLLSPHLGMCLLWSYIFTREVIV